MNPKFLAAFFASAKSKYATLESFANNKDLSKNDNELKKAVMRTKDGTYMTYVLTKYTANPTIDDDKFVFDIKKYPGYTLIKD